MTKIILVRHGETLWNKEMRYQGQTDIPLTPAGMVQASQVAQRLAAEPVQAVYSSDLSRAFVTAAHIAAVHALDVSTRRDLREISFGDWEGLTFASIEAAAAKGSRSLFTHPGEVEIPGGESFQQVQRRMVAAVGELRRRHEGETVVIVSHGAAIRTVLCEALGVELNRLWSFRQHNTAVNVLEYLPEQVLISLVNDAHHLHFPQAQP